MPETLDRRQRADRERSRLIGLAAVGGAGVIAFAVTMGIFLPAIGVIADQTGSSAVFDPATLPELIVVCDHEYARAAGDPATRTRDEARAADGRDPVVVSGVGDSECPANICVTGGLCVDVVYVSAGDDRYVAFTLQDGS